MKTLFKSLLAGFLLLVPIFLAMPAFAYDFMVDGLCYNINSWGTNVTVTREKSGAPSYSSLSGDLTIPASVTYDGTTYKVTEIGEAAFIGCTKLTSVTMNNPIYGIGESAFGDCTGLTSVEIPGTVTTIGACAFMGCRKLTSLYIPKRVVNIGQSAFKQCTGLTSITVHSGNTAYDSRDNCNALIETASNTLLIGCNNTIIPSTISAIGAYAFYQCRDLPSQTLPASLTSIGGFAFVDCTKLTSVTIPDQVTSVGSKAFVGCTGLTSVQWNARTSDDYSLNYSPFDGLKNIKSFTFGNSVQRIPARLLYGLSGLTSLTIPQSVTSVGNYAFNGCTGLTSVHWNPITCTDFSYSSSGDLHPFAGLKNITSFVFGDKVQRIPAHLCYALSKVTSITIPSSVNSIGNSAFQNCRGLTSITIPSSVTCVGYNVFHGCSGLTTVNLPNTLTKIDDCAFYECSNLASIEIPDKVTTIGHHAFYGCTSLTSVTIPKPVTSIGDCAFTGCSNLASVQWNAQACGEFFYYTTLKSPFSGLYTIKSFVFGDEVQRIPSCLCMGQNEMTSLYIPASVTSIGDKAFAGCSSLISIEVDEANPVYDSRGNCNALIETNSNKLLTGCNNTIIPNTIISIGEKAFSSCKGLTSVTIPNSVTSIGENAFSYCTGLTSLTRPCTTVCYTGSFSNCPISTLTLTGNGHIVNGAPSTLQTLNVGSEVLSLYSMNASPVIINSYAEVPPKCDSQSFKSYDGTLHVPSTSLAAYFSANYWNNFVNLNNDITEKVTMNQTDANMVMGKKLQLSATANPTGGALTWSTSNPQVAVVDENGVVTAIGAGNASIFASMASNLAVYASCSVKVGYPDFSLTVDPQNATLMVGEEITLQAIVMPNDLEVTPTWATSNKNVATVENGLVKAVGVGECDITVTVFNKNVKCHVTVNEPEDPDIIVTLDKETVHITPNEMIILLPTCTPDKEVEFVATSSATDVAMVRIVNHATAPNASGKVIQVLGIANGTATITVSTNEEKTVAATCLVIVGDFITGDVNGDGIVSGSDVTTLYNVLLNGATPVGDADVNGDGFVNGSDVTALYSILLDS